MKFSIWSGMRVVAVSWELIEGQNVSVKSFWMQFKKVWIFFCRFRSGIYLFTKCFQTIEEKLQLVKNQILNNMIELLMVVLEIDLSQIHQVWDRLGHSGVRQQLNLHQIPKNQRLVTTLRNWKHICMSFTISSILVVLMEGLGTSIENLQQYWPLQTARGAWSFVEVIAWISATPQTYKFHCIRESMGQSTKRVTNSS